MKTLLALLLLPTLVFAQDIDWDRLAKKADTRNAIYHHVQCDGFDKIVYSFRFEGNTIIYADIIDTINGFNRRYVINSVGCSITNFTTNERDIISKMRPPTEVPLQEVKKPKLPTLEDISKKRVALRKAISFMEHRLKTKFLYTIEKENLQKSIDLLKKQLSETKLQDNL
jgi:hypothetical protein